MRKRKQPKWFDEYVPEEVANSSLFRFTIKLGKPFLKSIKVDMKADLDIDYTIVQQQLEDSPSEFAYWAAIYSELKMMVGAFERSIKAKRGKLVDRAIKDASQAQVRLTDKQVQAIVDASEELGALERKMLLLQKHTGKAYFMVEALRMKCDNLRSLAGFARIEMGNS